MVKPRILIYSTVYAYTVEYILLYTILYILFIYTIYIYYIFTTHIRYVRTRPPCMKPNQAEAAPEQGRMHCIMKPNEAE